MVFSIFIFLIFYWYYIVVVPIFPPWPSSAQPSFHSHSQSPHCCPCPWVIHTCSLSSSFPFFPPLSPCLPPLWSLSVCSMFPHTGHVFIMCSPTHWWVVGCLIPDNLALVVTLWGQDGLSRTHPGSQELLKDFCSSSHQAFNWDPY